MEHYENNYQYEKHVSNIKTINEFLIDLIGVLVPGVIFLFSIIVSIVIPVIMIFFRVMPDPNINVYATKTDLLASNVFHGWFWLVLFFMFLILSYAIGNIFYRLDIKDVDKPSFKHQRKKLYKDKIKPIILKKKRRFEKIKECKLDLFYKEYFELLFYHLKDGREISRMDKQDWMDKFKNLRKKNNTEIINILNEVASLLYEKRIKEALELIDKKSNRNSSPNAYTYTKNSTVAKELLTKSKLLKPKDMENPEFLALGWYFLFYLRSEVACDCEEDCQFPYEHYDTYLLKRGELNLVNHATWCKDKDSRTKNALNTFKIKIQLKSKEAYNILIKNEAHIRMASSSYRVAKVVWKVALCAIFIPIVLLLPFSMELVKFLIIIFCMPVSTILLNFFIEDSVKEFLHYQRLREIFFVLQVYDELGISNDKKNAT